MYCTNRSKRHNLIAVILKVRKLNGLLSEQSVKPMHSRYQGRQTMYIFNTLRVPSTVDLQKYWVLLKPKNRIDQAAVIAGCVGRRHCLWLVCRSATTMYGASYDMEPWEGSIFCHRHRFRYDCLGLPPMIQGLGVLIAQPTYC